MPERQMQDANLLQQRRLRGCKNRKWEGKKHRGGGAAADEEREFLSKGERGGKKGTTISTRNSPTTGDARETFFKKKKKKGRKTEVWGLPLCCSLAAEGQPGEVAALGKGLQQPQVFGAEPGWRVGGALSRNSFLRLCCIAAA